jgi:carboxyl-terminal processing protease
VGQRTFGKGTVQNLLPLDRWTQKPVEGQLTVTIGKFYRITGESTQHRGVEPDIILPSAINMDEVGESSLPAALPWDRIAPASFQRVATPKAIPAALALDRSEAARNQSNPDYQWLVNTISATEKLRTQKSLSLNLARRKQERESFDANRLKRENERRVAQGKPTVPDLQTLDSTTEDSPHAVPDIVLARTAEIMGDIVAGNGAGATPDRAVVRQAAPAKTQSPAE